MRDQDKYLIDEYDKDVEELTASEDRLTPITVRSVKGKSIITILEQSITQWKPRDMRLERSYTQTHPLVEDTSEELLVDMAKGMTLKVEGRSIEENRITIAVMFQNNLAEFERYDNVVAKHNEDWMEAGEPEDTFNPKTGDIKKIKDRYVPPSRYEGVNPFGESDGELSKAKPRSKRKKYLTLTYRLDIVKNMFVLGFTAQDLAGKILYYNELTNDDLAYLVRRSVQELFGNPEVYDNMGAFYDGIPMLINGKKIKAYYDNKKPYWLKGEVKDASVPIALKAAESSTYRIVANLIRYVGLISGILFIVGYSIYAFGRMYAGDSVVDMSPNAINGWQVIFVIMGTLVAMYFMVMISGWLLRKSYTTEIESKFI